MTLRQNRDVISKDDRLLPPWLRKFVWEEILWDQCPVHGSKSVWFGTCEHENKS